MTKIIVTLGPATNTLDKLLMIKSKSIDFVRINMSHSTIEDLKYYINLAKKAEIPFIIDTEGSQVRTGHRTDRSNPCRRAGLRRRRVPLRHSFGVFLSDVLDETPDFDRIFLARG